MNAGFDRLSRSTYNTQLLLTKLNNGWIIDEGEDPLVGRSTDSLIMKSCLLGTELIDRIDVVVDGQTETPSIH
jgi:hypothetical protein